MNIVESIATGLTAKPEYQIDSVGFSNNKKEYFYISIELVLESKDSEVEDVVGEIEKAVRDFLQSDVALKAIQGEKYEGD